jgi:AcrR family transcriptional regulator
VDLTAPPPERWANSPTRARVLKAAAAAISERGLADTRVSDIAGRAGISPGNVMYYFNTLEDILIEALQFANEGFLDEALRDAEARTTARSRLIRLIELAMPSDPALESHSQWLLWLDVWARSPRNPTVDANRRELEGRWIDAYARLVREGQAAGEFRECDPEDFAVRLSALIDGLGKTVVLGDEWMTLPRMLEICAGVVRAELDPPDNELQAAEQIAQRLGVGAECRPALVSESKRGDRHGPVLALLAADVVGFFELAQVDDQVPWGEPDHVLQPGERERVAVG